MTHNSKEVETPAHEIIVASSKNEQQQCFDVVSPNYSTSNLKSSKSYKLAESECISSRTEIPIGT